MRRVLFDAADAARILARAPRFSLAVVTILGLGIGLNIGIYGAVDAVLVRPLPYPEAEEIVVLDGARFTRKASGTLSVEDWVSSSTALSTSALFVSGSLNLSSARGSERVRAAQVSAGFFPTFATTPLLGRPLGREDFRPGPARTLVLGHELWRRHFAEDRSLVGRQILVNGLPYEIVGVMPAGFAFPHGTDVWVPVSLAERLFLGGLQFHFVGRLAPRRDFEEAQAEMAVLAAQQHAQEDGRPRDVRLVPLQERLTGSTRPALLLLLGAVGFVLLIVCANVSNLLLAHTSKRWQEIAVRKALGASGARIGSLLLMESLLLSLLGGILGFVSAVLAGRLVLPSLPNTLPALGVEALLGGRVLGFTTAIPVFVGLLCGFVPAWHAARSHEVSGLRSASAHAPGAQLRTIRYFVVAEIGLALLLLVGAGLMTRSVSNLLAVPTGFDGAGVITMEVSLRDARYAEAEKRRDYVARALDALGGLPTVVAAGATNNLPFGETTEMRGAVFPGERPLRDSEAPLAAWRIAAPGYFQSLGLPVLAGRTFNAWDTATSTRVVVVTQGLARRLWGESEPVGRRLKFEWDDEWREVVGVVADVRHDTLLEKPVFGAYLPYAEEPWPYVSFLVRGTGEPEELARVARSRLQGLDPTIPVHAVRFLDERVASSIAGRRFSTLGMLLFSSCALLLSTLGVLATITYSVSRRTREIGIRMALGARPFEILKNAFGEGLRLTGCGILLGLVGAVALTRLLKGFLFHVEPADPLTLGLGACVVCLAGLIATVFPARQAATVDPAVALRQE